MIIIRLSDIAILKMTIDVQYTEAELQIPKHSHNSSFFCTFSHSNISFQHYSHVCDVLVYTAWIQVDVIH